MNAAKHCGMNTLNTFLLVLLVPSTFVACAAETDPGESADDVAARKVVPTEIVLNSKNSPETKAFLSTWMKRFGRLANQEGGKSTSDDDVSTYTVKRNDGVITCVEDLEWNRECTFKLETVKVKKLPVSTGDRNYLAGTIRTAFDVASGIPLGTGVTQEGTESLTIGSPDKGPFIACRRVEDVRGLEVSECTFNLK